MPTRARARRDGRRRALTALGTAAVLAGLGALTLGVAGQERAATLPADGLRVDRDVPIGGERRTTRPRQRARAVPASPPVGLQLPTIDVRADVFATGTARDGTLRVPSGKRRDDVAWYRGSSTPGQPGPTVLTGHVDTRHGRSVFFRLADLRPGDRVRVQRRDRQVATFVVRRLQSFPQDQFPTRQVYGGRPGVPSLRLITCSAFDDDLGAHTENLVVFADLVKVRARS